MSLIELCLSFGLMSLLLSWIGGFQSHTRAVASAWEEDLWLRHKFDSLYSQTDLNFLNTKAPYLSPLASCLNGSCSASLSNQVLWYQEPLGSRGESCQGDCPWMAYGYFWATCLEIPCNPEALHVRYQLRSLKKSYPRDEDFWALGQVGMGIQTWSTTLSLPQTERKICPSPYVLTKENGAFTCQCPPPLEEINGVCKSPNAGFCPNGSRYGGLNEQWQPQCISFTCEDLSGVSECPKGAWLQKIIPVARPSHNQAPVNAACFALPCGIKASGGTCTNQAFCTWKYRCCRDVGTI